VSALTRAAVDLTSARPHQRRWLPRHQHQWGRACQPRAAPGRPRGRLRHRPLV